MMKVPKGTSDYQAMWIVDEDEEENGEIDEESSDDDDDNDDMLDEAMDGEDEENNSQVHIQSISGHFRPFYYRQWRETQRLMIIDNFLSIILYISVVYNLKFQFETSCLRAAAEWWCVKLHPT